jgi:uncharacterized protein
MTEMTAYAPGTPSWVDLGTPDVIQTVSFYSQLLGWDIPEPEDAEQTGGYRIATQRGKSAAGVMPLMQEGQPPAWTTYVNVEDADATAEAVRAAGGSVLAEPMDVMELGRMAVFADPTGAVFGIWQAKSFHGAEIVNEPGAFSWNELNSRDPDAAKAFYGTVFGWEASEMEMGESGSYTIFRLAGTEEGSGIAGLLDLRGRAPEQVPAHWLTYFTVEDRDAALQQAKGSGAEEMLTMELEMGRLAILTDPQGAAFGIFEDTGGSA